MKRLFGESEARKVLLKSSSFFVTSQIQGSFHVIVHDRKCKTIINANLNNRKESCTTTPEKTPHASQHKQYKSAANTAEIKVKAAYRKCLERLRSLPMALRGFEEVPELS